MVANRRNEQAIPGWLVGLRSAEALYVTNDEQRIVMWSSSAERVLGYTEDEVLGRRCYEVIAGLNQRGHPVCRPDCPVAVNARRGRVTAPYDVLARRQDGGRVWLNSGVTLARPENGCGALLLHLSRELRHAPPATRRAAGQAAAEDAAEPPAGEPLSRRELEVLRLLVAKKTTAEVAEVLTVSPFTARNHIANIQRKLGARNRVEAILIAANRRLI